MEEKREGEKKKKRKRKRRIREAKQKGMDSCMDFYDFWYGYMTFVWILVRFCPKIYLDMDF